MQLNREILIDNNSLVEDIQRKFSAFYPFLKIEMLYRKNEVIQNRNIYLEPRFSLQQMVAGKSVHINVENSRTVAELTKDIQQLLPVIVEVSRKSGKVWNAISLSDGWTLESQNAAGEFICTEMARPVD